MTACLALSQKAFPFEDRIAHALIIVASHFILHGEEAAKLHAERGRLRARKKAAKLLIAADLDESAVKAVAGFYERKRIGPPRFRGIRTVFATVLMLAVGTWWATIATLVLERIGK